MDETKEKKRGKKRSRKSTSSKTADRSRIFPELAELGLRIAEDIGAEEERNTTGKWIAQFLAEKLKEAERDASKEEECVDLILRLWQSRRHWPSGDPFAKYDDMIAQIDRRSVSHGYHPTARSACKHSEEDSWIDIAAELDEVSDALRYELIKKGALEMGIEDDELLHVSADEAKDSQVQLLIRIRELAAESPPELTEIIASLKRLIDKIETKSKAHTRR